VLCLPLPQYRFDVVLKEDRGRSVRGRKVKRYRKKIANRNIEAIFVEPGLKYSPDLL
jgi:hypothetical protein